MFELEGGAVGALPCLGSWEHETLEAPGLQRTAVS